MLKRYTIFLLLFTALAFDGFGQVTIAQQDFETTPVTPTLTFSNTNGTNSTGTNGASGLPANSNLFVSGLRGWQAVGTTSTLIFSNTDLSSYVSKSLTFRLAGMSVNNTNGIDGTDIVTVSISTDGGTSYSSELTIAGSAANQRWDFTAAGSSTITYDGNNTPTAVTSSSGSGGITSITINLPDAMTQVRVKIALLNDVTNERWVIDDVKLVGTALPTAIAINSVPVSAGNVNQDSDNNLIYGIQCAVTSANATLNSITVTSAGSYSVSDIKTNGFKLWYSTDNTFNSGTDVNIKTIAAVGSGGSLAFTGLAQSISNGSSGFFFVTADIAASATAGNTINIQSTAFANIVFAFGTKSGTDPIAAGGAQTIFAYDNDTEIYEHSPQVSATTISSLAVTSGSAVEVFKFDIQEQSSTDGAPTKVTNIKLIPGSVPNAAAWSSTIAGVVVKKDGSTVTIGTPTITDAAINIPIPSGNLDIDNGGTAVISISVYLKDSGIDESKVLAFKIPGTVHGFTADASGTGFASSLFLGDFSSATFPVSVVATNLYFSSVPSIVTLSTNFSATIKATDIYNNPDLQATNPVTLSRSGGSGILSSISGLTQSLVGGSVTWSDVRYNTQEQFEIKAAADGLTSGFAPNISFTTTGYATDLFISEYVEGSSNNKYIEIFNGTGVSKNLADYNLKQYNAGGATPSSPLTLNGTLENNSAFVIMNSSASLTLPDGVTPFSTTSTVMQYNGDDAVALFKGSTLIDLFGNNGGDPGTAWTSGVHTTVNKTLRRKSSVFQGISVDPSGADFPTLVSEWDVFPEDQADGLGSHTFSAPSVVLGNQTVSATGTYDFADKHLRLEFTSVGGGGTINVAFYGNPASNISGTTGTTSQYRWVITNNGVTGFTVNFRIKRSSFLGLTSATPGNSDVKLYKRETPGSGSFTDLGFMTYDDVNDEYYLAINSFSEIIVQSESEPLPVELTSFTARAAGSVVNLNWETATEVDNNGFDVERNSTGTWQKIGFVEGHGTANSPKYYNFTDKSVTGNKIQYRLRQVDNDGTFAYSNVVEVELAPTSFVLDQNYPNPFNPATMIRFSLPTASVVTLTVYNTLGEKVVTLLNGVMESGYHQVSFDAANLPSGLYLYEIKAGEFSSIKKMILMK